MNSDKALYLIISYYNKYIDKFYHITYKEMKIEKQTLGCCFFQIALRYCAVLVT